MRRVLWIFAHQDDEVAAAARILAARRRGEEVWCAYLTDGGAAAVRNEESTAALKTLGVTNVVFFDHPDGALHRHIDEAVRELESIDARFDEVGTLAWEGGHQDHDAAHLVALAFAQKRELDVLEVPLYNGFGVPGPLFRVMRPIGEGWERTKITFDDALRIIALTRFYRSQRRTWLGLLPEALVRLFVLRRTYVRRADPARAKSAPHPGRLFYERRFAIARADACPVCDHTRFRRKRLLPNLSVDRCTGCGLRISDVGATKQVSYAHIDDEAYLQSIGLVRKQQAKEIVGAVKASGEWLDIGCGFGFVLDEARRAGFRVRGVEPDAKAAALARERIGNVEQQDDGRDADVISTLDVIEHIPPAELNGFAEAIRRRAAVWVVKVPSSEGLFFKVAHALLPFTRSAVRRLWQSDHEYPHTVYFDRKTLTHFLEKHGFEIETVGYLDEVPAGTAKQRMLLDPTIPRWLATLAAPLFGVVNRVERLRGTSDALLVIARSDRR